MFPGGDHDSLRPFWHFNRVDFLGRKGFLRIAIRSGVPLVPMGITGSHFTCPMLFRSALYSRLLVLPARLGFKRWGMSIGSVLGCLGIAALPCSPWVQGPLIWLFLVSPLQFIPLVPWKIRFRIGAPIESTEWDEGALEEPYHSVLTAVRNLVR